MQKKTESFDDIIFEKRNKEYGAYDLRIKYLKRGLLSLLFSFLFVVILFLVILYKNKLNLQNQEVDLEESVVLVLNDIKNVDKKQIDLEIPKPFEKDNLIKEDVLQIKKNIDNLIKNTEPQIVIVDEEIVDLNNIFEEEDSLNNSNIDLNLNSIEEENFEDEAPYLIADVLPEFVGGENALNEFIKNNLVYPEDAKTNGIKGKVYVSFIVSSTGTIDSTKIVFGIYKSLDAEALRIVKLFPNWKPGQVNGRNISVLHTVRIVFKL